MKFITWIDTWIAYRIYRNYAWRKSRQSAITIGFSGDTYRMMIGGYVYLLLDRGDGKKQFIMHAKENPKVGNYQVLNADNKFLYDYVKKFIDNHELLTERPPQGLMPKYIWDEKRLRAINEACERYNNVGKDIPAEWEAERKEIIVRLKRGRSYKNN